MSLSLHHLHKRKRIHQKKETYPHPHAHKRFVDRLIYVAGIIVPVLTLQQSYLIHSTKNAEGISLFSFSGFVCMNLIWLWYGIIHKETPIIFMYILLATFNTSIVAGVLMYN